MATSNGTTNGRARSNGKVRVAIIGAGNCANSLLQGVQYYKDAPEDKTVPGLMHVDLGGYHISDIEFVAAFDVVKGKVGVDLADAIWAHPNDTIKFSDVPKTGVTVSRGMTQTASAVPGRGRREGRGPDGRCRRHPPETGADVVVNYLPVGRGGGQVYAEQSSTPAARW
jgi:myo-inositol-1-phosphate synthase